MHGRACVHMSGCVFARLSVWRQSHFLKHVRHNPAIAVGEIDEACRQIIERQSKTLRERERGRSHMSRCDYPHLSSTFKAPLKISKMGLFRPCICLYLEIDFGFIYNPYSLTHTRTHSCSNSGSGFEVFQSFGRVFLNGKNTHVNKSFLESCTSFLLTVSELDSVVFSQHKCVESRSHYPRVILKSNRLA